MGDVWEGTEPVDRETFLRVLSVAARVLQDGPRPYLLIGGLASSALGRPRWTRDIDVLVKPGDARDVLGRLRRAGFATREEDPNWLFKAALDDVLVDVLFRCEGGVELDDEMLARARNAQVGPVRLPIPAPEDLIVIKALAHKEHTSRHWFDALALLAREGLDWGALVRRALLYDERRVASLLLYAQSMGTPVPESVVRTLLNRRGGERTEVGWPRAASAAST